MLLNRRHVLLWLPPTFCLLAGCRGSLPDRTSVEPTETDVTSVASQPGFGPAQSAIASTVPIDRSGDVPKTILAWDAVDKTVKVKPGEESASLAFNVTNVSAATVEIYSTGTSCGCTVADLPADPWKLLPGDHGQIAVTMDLNGQPMPMTKEVMVFTSKGNALLTVSADAAEAADTGNPLGK